MGTPKRSPDPDRGLLGLKPPGSVGQGRVDTVLGEANEIGAAVAVYVRKLAWGEVLAAPAARLGTPKRSPDRGLLGLKPPRSVGQGHVDTVLGEADDISRAVAVYVRHKARVFVLAAPAARFGTPKRSPDRGLLGLKPPVSVALGHVDTVLGEADDFGQVEAVSVRKQARVGVLAAPAARLGTPKRSPTRELLGLKPPGSVGQGHVDTVSGEADDVSRAVVVYVRKLAWVGVLAVPAAAGTKGVENRSRRPQN